MFKQNKRIHTYKNILLNVRILVIFEKHHDIILSNLFIIL